MLSPKVEPEAGVEALFWKVYVADEVQGSDLRRVLNHYVRLKVFTDKGREQASAVSIPYSEKTSILNVRGRTIRPDGTIVELEKSGIHDSELVRARGLKRSAKTLSMPAVEKGAIVEYRWQEVRSDPNSLYLRLQLQREYPVQKVTYHVKPLPYERTTYTMGVWPFNCKPGPLELDHKTGFSVTSLENVPAFQEEDMMPDEANLRPWLLIFYHNGSKRDPEKYWTEVGRDTYKHLKSALKISDELKSAAVAATAEAPEENRPLLLIRHIRSNLRNFYDSSVSDAERAQILKQMPKFEWRTADKIYQSRIGTPDELNILFAAMAQAVGLEARPALVASRSDIQFDERLTDRHFLRNVDMAVKLGDQWRLYDVSARDLPPSMLLWHEEGVKALISDPKKPVWMQTEMSPPDASLTSRIADLRLGNEGEVIGSVSEKYSGHSAARQRRLLLNESDVRRQEIVKERVAQVFPQAQLTEIRIEGVENTELPLTIAYRIEASGYAERTGKRLFFHPFFFQRGETPLFAQSQRKYDIEFPFAWRESDRVSITMPEGYELDSPDRPEDLSFGKVGGYKVSIKTNSGKVVAQRDFTFGENQQLQFPQSSYGILTQAFSQIHRRDSHTLAAKPAAQAAAKPSAGIVSGSAESK